MAEQGHAAVAKGIEEVLTGQIRESSAALCIEIWHGSAQPVQAGLVPLGQAQYLMRDLKIGERGDRIPRYLLSQR